MQAYFIGALAGIASLVVMTAAAFGGLFAFLLMLLAPLPIAIVSLGWGTNAAATSTLLSVGGIIPLAGLEPAAIYAVLVALPVAIAGYQIGLARPSAEVTGNAGDTGLLWFPIGATLASVALTIGVGLVVLGFLSGQTLVDAKISIQEIVKSAFQGGEQSLSDGELAAIADLYSQVMPFFVPAVWTILVVFNLWLGGKIVRRSGRLTRPWPDLALAELPVIYSLLFAVMAALALTSGLLGLAARPLAGAFFSVFLLVGLGILHVFLRGKPARNLLLPLSYFGIFFLSFPALIFVALGALEPFFRFRQRLLRK